MKKEPKTKKKTQQDLDVILGLKDGMVCVTVTNNTEELSKRKELKVITIGPMHEVMTYWMLQMGITQATLENYRLRFEYKERKKSNVLSFFSKTDRSSPKP